jgi:hypothetical protein
MAAGGEQWSEFSFSCPAGDRGRADAEHGSGLTRSKQRVIAGEVLLWEFGRQRVMPI